MALVRPNTNRDFRESPNCVVFRDQNRLYLTIKISKITLEEAKHDWALIEDLMGLSPFSMFVEYDFSSFPSSDVRKFWTDKSKAQISAVAAVTDSKIAKLFGHFMIGLTAGFTKARLFNRFDEALSWLQRIDGQSSNIDRFHEIIEECRHQIKSDPFPYLLKPINGTNICEIKSKGPVQLTPAIVSRLADELKSFSIRCQSKVSIINYPGKITFADPRSLRSLADLEFIDRAALILGTGFSYFLANFFMRLTKKAYPVRLFNDRDEAISWLMNRDTEDISVPNSTPLKSDVDRIQDVLISFAEKNFSPRIKCDHIQDENLRLISLAINTLGDELYHSTVSKDELEQQNAFLSTIVENIPLGLVIKDVRNDYKITLWNRGAEKILGHDREVMLGKRALESLANEAARISLESDLQTVAKGKLLELPETEANIPGRGLVPLNIKKLPIFDPTSSTCSYLLVIFEDLSERKQAQEREKQAKTDLKNQEQLLRNLVNGIPALVSYWGHDLRNVIANSYYQRYFGKSAEQMKGLHIRDMVGEAVFEKAKPMIERVLSGHAQILENSVPTPEGIRHLRVHYQPNIIDGVVNGYYVVATDITEERKSEERVLIEREKSLQANRLATLGEIAAGIGHEINNPMAIIDGKAVRALKLLSHEPINLQEIRNSLNDIKETSQRVIKIVSGLRSVSRDGKADPHQLFDLKQLWEETLLICRGRLLQHEVTLSADFQTDRTTILGNSTQVSQILFNLISNADDALADTKDKWLLLEVKEAGEFLAISLTNGGNKISEDVQSKIFTPFFTTKEVGKGTGLGLSLSRKIAEAHNGSLEIDPTCPNTRFILRLPLSEGISPARSA